MKNIIKFSLLSLIFFLGGRTYSQTQSWQWGKSFPGDTYGVTTDNHGNVYVLWGVGTGGYTIDGHYIANISGGDNALTSFTCDGQYRWTRVFGGGGEDRGGRMGIDSLGGVYVLGRNAPNPNPPLHIGNDTIIPSSYKILYLIKFDTLGQFQWIRQPDPDTATSLLNNFLGMSVQPNGTCILYTALAPGSYGDGAFTATFPYVYGSNRGENIYGLKYDRNGNSLGGLHFDFYWSGFPLSGIKWAHDEKTGNIYMGGQAVGTNNQDTLILGGTDTLISDFGGPRMVATWLAAFDSSGNYLWLTKPSPDSLSGTYPLYPSVDKQGNIYGSVCAGTGLNWGGFQMTNNLSNIPQYSFPVLLKFDSLGNLIWGTNASTNLAASLMTSCTVHDNIVGLSGDYGGKITWGNFGAYAHAPQSLGNDMFFARFNATTGDILSFDTLISSPYSNEFPLDVVADKQGNFYVSGTFTGAVYVNQDSLYYQSGLLNDAFVAKFGSANCHCTVPSAHYTYGSLSNGGNVSFTYDGSQPVDSVVWDFGDSQTATGFTVSHTYTQTGDYTVCATAYNSCGSNMSCQSLHIETGLGINDLPGLAHLRIYPNPAVQTLTIEGVDAGTQLSVYDGLGRKALQTQLHGGKDILNVSRLSPGVYLLLFRDKNGNSGNVKFVKE